MSAKLDLTKLREAIPAIAPVTEKTLGAGRGQLNVRMSEKGLAAVKRAAKRMGIEQGDLVRIALAHYIGEWEQRHREELERMKGLADQIAEEWRVVVAQLPEGELAEDEPLNFTADNHGHVWARLDRDPNIFYTIYESYFAWKVDTARKKVTIYRKGQVVAEQDLPEGVLP